MVEFQRAPGTGETAGRPDAPDPGHGLKDPEDFGFVQVYDDTLGIVTDAFEPIMELPQPLPLVFLILFILAANAIRVMLRSRDRGQHGDGGGGGGWDFDGGGDGGGGD
ncbi:MAG: hypothetical protein AAFS07_05625 [Pseudomonadota bacterium]